MHTLFTLRQISFIKLKKKKLIKNQILLTVITDMF